MRKKLLLFSVAFLVMGLMAFAQDRTVSGRVTSTEDGTALPGVNVVLKGTSIGTSTDADGNFSLSIPSSGGALVFSFIGLESREIEIGDRTTVDVSLALDVTQLTEVVVTAQGIQQEKRALGYAVASVDQKSLELRPEADIGRLLRGKMAGIDIMQTSGLAGSGTNIIIRGYSSITGTNQPLFVVDGVPFGSDTDQDRSDLNGGATSSSRFLDIDPNNIADVSVLKGLSATVLYGEAGRNGVVVITTKNGSGRQLNRKMEITVDQSIFTNQIASLPDDQDKYGNGFQNLASAAFSNWGAPFDQPGKNGVAADGTIRHPYDRSSLASVFPQYQGARYEYKAYDNLQNFFETGIISTTSVNISSRINDQNSLNFSYGYRDEEGFVPLSNYNKHNFGFGYNGKLQNGLQIITSFNYVNSDRVAPPAGASFSSNPFNASLFSNVFYTPRSVSLFGLEYENPQTHESIFYRGGNDIQHPLWTLHNTSDEEKISRFFGSISLRYEINDWLTLGYRVGLDGYNQRKRFWVNKGAGQIADGTLQTSERINFIQDHNYSVAVNKDLNTDLNLTAVGGLNLRRDIRDNTFTNSTEQFVYGLVTHDNFVNHNNSSSSREENLIGAYLTATLGWRNSIYLGVQARNDWTSTLEKENRSILYPSASISFIPTEMVSSLQDMGIDYLKVRFGYGTSAGYPNPYATRSVLAVNTREFVMKDGSVINTNSISDFYGNINLQPELHSELEAGLEAKLFNNIIGIDLSLYDKRSTDLIINLPLDNSTGFSSTTVNAAEIRNKGIELSLNITPIRTDALTVSLNTNFTKNVGTVESLYPGVDRVPVRQIFGSGLGSYAIPGEPYGIILGDKVRRDATTGERVVGSSGIYLLQNEVQPLGNPQPNFLLNNGLTVTFKGVTLNALVTYVDGGVIYATLPSTLMGRGVLQETDFDRFVPVIAPGVKEDGTPNDIQITSTDHYWQNGGVFIDEMRTYDGTYLKLREVSLSYSLPKSLLAKTPFGNITVSLSGQNLWFSAFGFPKGANFDPEVISTGVGNARGFEFMNVPTSKQFGGSIRITL